MNCPSRPAVAQIRITDCYLGVLTSSNPRDNMTWDTRTDTKGRYHVDLEPGTYCIVASNEGGAFPISASQTSVTVRAGQVTTVNLTMGIPVGIGL
jgi:Carboxypeptidase regulatory-like domain